MKTISKLIKKLVSSDSSINTSKYILEYSPECKGKIRIEKTSGNPDYQWKPDKGKEVNVVLNTDRKFKIEICKVKENYLGKLITTYVAETTFYMKRKPKVENTLKLAISKGFFEQVFSEGLCKNSDKVSKMRVPITGNHLLGTIVRFKKKESFTVKFYTYLSSDIDNIIESIEEVLGEYGENILKIV